MTSVRVGEKLFTVEFSSSYDYDYDYDDQSPKNKTPKQTPKRQLAISNTKGKQVNKNKPNIGGMIELSDSYSENSYSGEKIKIKKIHIQGKQSDSEYSEENDVFVLADTDQNDDTTTDSVNTKVTVSQVNINSNDNDHFNFKDEKNEDNRNDYQQDVQPDQITIQNQKLPKEVTTPNQSPLKLSLSDNLSPKSSENLETQYPIYLIKREKKTHLNGQRLFFNLYIGNQQIYTAKCKTKSAHHVYIMKGTDVHLGSTADALILIGNDSSDFSLRKKKDLGAEIMTIRILPPRTTADTSRKMTVSFFAPLEGTPNKIYTKSPGLNQEGKIEHDFEGKFAIESIKNAVLVAKPEGPKMMFIRKIGENSIEIEARFEHEDLWIFAIGIASFLSKVKGIK